MFYSLLVLGNELQAVLEYSKASSNNPVECLKLEISKRRFLMRRSNKR